MESTTEGVSAYSPRQIGASLSSIASSSHSSSNDCKLSNPEPRAAVSSESAAEIQEVHSAVHDLDLARTPHSSTRMRAMAGSDQPIPSSPKSFRSFSSGTQSAIRFPEETETSEQSMSVRGERRPEIAAKTINALRSRRRNAARKRLISKSYTSSSITASPLYSRSTASSCAHSSENKPSSHQSKAPSASRARSSGMKSASHYSKSPSASLAHSSDKKFSSHHSKSSTLSQHGKLPALSQDGKQALSHARSSDKKSSSHSSKPVLSRSRLPYHERPSRRERSSRQSIELAMRIQRGKEEAKAQKEKEETVFVFNVRKHVLVDLLRSLYDQPDDTMIAIRLKKDQLRTLSEHEASKERRRQRRQRE